MVCCRAKLRNGRGCSSKAVLGGYCIIHFNLYATRSEKRLIKRASNNRLKKKAVAMRESVVLNGGCPSCKVYLVEKGFSKCLNCGRSKK